MSDGRNALALATSQDHKRLLDGDRGPNTGGMGAYSPAPIVTPTIHARVMREIILPTIQGMAADGIPYTGFLYAGLMIDGHGQARTLEFNCRMGDPETQPIMARLKTDFVLLLDAAIDGRLDQVEAEWDRRTALGVVVAAAGYPDAPRKGDAITRLPEERDDCITFHAGTALERRHAGHQRWPGPVRDCARRHRPRGAEDPPTTPSRRSSSTACNSGMTSVTGR